MNAHRQFIDARSLPEVVFGREALTWWATAGFMLVEGTTMAVLGVSVLYLRLNETSWPPRPWPAPSVIVPTMNLLLILATIWPMQRARRAARALDRHGVVRWLSVASACSAVSVVLRALEFDALHVKWDSNAYGSASWAVLVSHTLLLVTDLVEAVVFVALFTLGRHAPRHYSDVEDAAVYQWFLSLSWVPLYVLLFVMPRVWS